MNIIDALKELLALEEAKDKAFHFTGKNKLPTCEEIQAELNRKIQEQPETQAAQAYISVLQKMIYWHYMNLPRQIGVEKFIQSGRLEALEFAIDELGNLPKIEQEIAKTEQRLDKLAVTRGEYSSPHLSFTGYLEALLEAKELIQQLNNQ
jgi:hypothetical protein